MKKIFSIAALLFLVPVLFSGCSSDKISYDPLFDYTRLDESSPEQHLGDEHITIDIPGRSSHQTYIPVIVSGLDENVWAPMQEGIERAAKEYNIHVEYFVTEEDESRQYQTDAFREVLTNNPGAICLIADDTSRLAPYLNKVVAADIPVISLDSSMPVGSVAQCRANGRSAGEDAAKQLAEAIRSRGKVAIAASDWKNVTSAEIIESFKNAVAENYPKIEVANVPSNPEVSMYEQCSAFFVSNPSIEAVFGVDSKSFECLISASKAIKAATTDDDEEPRNIYVCGVGTSSFINRAIQSGDALGSYIINYTDWGYNALTTAFSAYMGGEFESEVLTDFIWVNTENMGLPLIKKLLSY